MALYLYQDYDIEPFEAGQGLWHARIRRTDQQPVVIEGCGFPFVEVGFAWPDPETAIADARDYIDRCQPQWSTPTGAQQAA
jgi:hypothetical protein